MPRNYVKKCTRKYSAASLQSALLAVKRGKTIHAAAQKFEIPYQTLRRWVINQPRRKGPGRDTWLTIEEESCIVEGLRFISRCGHPVDRTDVTNLISTYFLYPNTRESPFGGKPPGEDFLKNFEKRWENQLTQRKPELKESRAANLTAQTITSFFNLYTQVIVNNSLSESPNRIFSLAEVQMGTDSRKNPVFVQKSSCTAYIKSANGGKRMYSVLFCSSASGEYMPPFAIYKGTQLYKQWTEGGPPGALYACTESGTLRDTVFESWMDRFTQFSSNLQKPVVLVYDGLGIHMTYGTIKKAIDNSIILLFLPPHTSHVLQPLDVGVFSPLKKAWTGILKQWFRKSRFQTVSKSDFPFLLRKLLEGLQPENAVKGFKDSGLFPIRKEEVMKRVILSQTDLQETEAKLNLTQSTANLNEYSETGPSRINIEQNEIVGVADNILVSPLEDLKAILATLSPSVSAEHKLSIQNSGQKRKHVQAKNGEVLTGETVIKRLKKEQEAKQLKTSKRKTNKKQKMSSSQANEPSSVNNQLSKKNFCRMLALSEI